MAAIGKLARLRASVAAIRGYGILPDRVVGTVLGSAVAAEVAISLSLLLGIRVGYALVGAACLLVAFSVASLLAIRESGNVECGCLGSALTIRLDRVTVGVNVALAVACVVAATQPVAALPLPTGAGGSAQAAIVSWCAGLALAILYWLAAYGRSVLRLVEDNLRSEVT